MSTQGHEKEAVNVEGLKAALKSSGNKAIYNEAICSTAGGTAAKVTNTVPPSFSLVSGAKILVKFTYAITVANATLQVGTNAAKPIFYHGAALAANLIKAGTSLLLTYDGTNFNVVGDINTDTTYQVMGASGANHASGLVPDTPSEAGTTKFLREDGTWTEPVSAGDGIDITNNEISVDSTVIYTKTQVDGQFIVIVNSNSEPTSSTLTYTATDGTIKSFKIGDEIRVPDAEADNGYTFYKLYKLETVSDVTTATWEKLGAGGAVNPNETVNISLTQVNGDSADLIGAAVTISDDDSGDTLFTGTWNGNTLTTEIDVNTNYTVSVDTIVGYLACALQSYQAGYQTERNITFQYRAYGAYIEATDGTLYTSSTWSGSGKTANAVVIVTNNTSFRMSLETYAMKMSPKNGDDYTLAFDPSPYLTKVTTPTADYDGKTRNQQMINYLVAWGKNSIEFAPIFAKSYRFTTGQEGYIGASGQICTLMLNHTEVENCLSACGGESLSTTKTGDQGVSVHCILSSTYAGFRDNNANPANWFNQVGNYQPRYDASFGVTYMVRIFADY